MKIIEHTQRGVVEHELTVIPHSDYVDVYLVVGCANVKLSLTCEEAKEFRTELTRAINKASKE